jgi:hypothetical protein
MSLGPPACGGCWSSFSAKKEILRGYELGLLS